VVTAGIRVNGVVRAVLLQRGKEWATLPAFNRTPHNFPLTSPERVLTVAVYEFPPIKTVQGLIDDHKSLPERGAVGDAWYEEHAGLLWVWDQDKHTWRELNLWRGKGFAASVASLIGLGGGTSASRGDVGVAGARGLSGPMGERGPAGPAGERGLAGPAGERGPAGPAGAPGKDGAPGKNGLDGKAGPAGPAGAPGKDGAPGKNGLDGKAGPKGERGPAGPAGSPGKDGAAGKDGKNGADGKAGPKGERGPAGPAGSPGKDGAAGKDGKNGADGKAGPKGERGPAGPAGKDGKNGADGKAGPKGERGPAGPAGERGPAGPAGTDLRSGARDISSLLRIPDAVRLDNAVLRRVGDTVELSLSGLRSKKRLDNVIGAVPAGFRPARPLSLCTADSDFQHVRVAVDADGSAAIRADQPKQASGLASTSMSLVWLTNDPWPSKMPGKEWRS